MELNLYNLNAEEGFIALNYHFIRTEKSLDSFI